MKILCFNFNYKSFLNLPLDLRVIHFDLMDLYIESNYIQVLNYFENFVFANKCFDYVRLSHLGIVLFILLSIPTYFRFGPYQVFLNLGV